MSTANFIATPGVLIEYLSVLGTLEKNQFVSTSAYGSRQALLEERVNAFSSNPIVVNLKNEKYQEWEKVALSEAEVVKVFLVTNNHNMSSTPEVTLARLLTCVNDFEGFRTKIFKLFKISNTATTKNVMTSPEFANQYFTCIIPIMNVQSQLAKTGKEKAATRVASVAADRAKKHENADALRSHMDRVDSGPAGLTMSDAGSYIPHPTAFATSAFKPSSSSMSDENTVGNFDLSELQPELNAKRHNNEANIIGEEYDDNHDSKKRKTMLDEGKLSNKQAQALSKKKVHKGAAASSRTALVDAPEPVASQSAPVITMMTELLGTKAAGAQKKSDAEAEKQRLRADADAEKQRLRTDADAEKHRLKAATDAEKHRLKAATDANKQRLKEIDQMQALFSSPLATEALKAYAETRLLALMSTTAADST
jgi:hypothetical protein